MLFQNTQRIIITVLLLISHPFNIIADSSYSSTAYEWEYGDPLSAGFDSKEMEKIANDLPYLRSVLVLHSGKLIFERYYNDAKNTSAFHIHSATKSFISTLIGIAFSKNILTDLDQKMMDFFPEYEYLDLDPRKYDITIRHLLTMKAGFNFNDTGDEWVRYSSSSDWVKYALELPLIHDPGMDWHYGTPQSNLLSVILTKASGMSTYDFAQENLFVPLNISIAHWYQDPQGFYTGGHEMYFSPRDLVRYGFLYLNNGSVNEIEIVPHQWILESWTDYSNSRVDEGMSSSFYSKTGYGYQWWLVDLLDFDTYSARGAGGQFIFVVPQLDLVIVTTAMGAVVNPYPFQYETMISIISEAIGGIELGGAIKISDEKKTDNNRIKSFLLNYAILTLMISLVLKKRMRSREI